MISTLDLAKLTNRRHDHTLRTVRSLIQHGILEDRKENFYIDSKNRKAPCYLLTNDEVIHITRQLEPRINNKLINQTESVLKAIEQVNNIIIKRKYKIGSYTVNGYDSENNVVYVIEFANHLHTKHGLKDEEYITKKLGCKFVRIKI